MEEPFKRLWKTATGAEQDTILAALVAAQPKIYVIRRELAESDDDDVWVIPAGSLSGPPSRRPSKPP